MFEDGHNYFFIMPEMPWKRNKTMFHIAQGWFFERLDGGRVHIVKHETANEKSSIIEEIIFTPNQWASIVASVSQHGDREPFFSQCLAFHGDH